MMKKSKIIICSLFFLMVILLASSNLAAFAAPADQNFDSAGVGDKGSQTYTLDGIIYSTNDSGGLNINVVNDGNIASGGDLALGYRSSGVNSTTQVSFKTADGTKFKLNSFVISTGLGDMTVTIKGYRDGGEVASSSATTASFTTFNVSANSSWEYIDEVRITGADLDIDLDDIDFSPPVLPTYTVTYSGNNNTGGAAPTDGNAYNSSATVTVLGNTGSLIKTGYTFNGWNTAANGSGTSYNGGDTFAMGSSNVTLYAQWTAVNYTVTYVGNTSTGGAVPTDGNTYHITNTVTVLGNTGSLVKTGYTFSGWNTAANGSGTSYNGGDTFAMGSSNVTLYAQWTENTYSVTYNGNNKTGGSVPTDGTSYHNGNTATVLGNTGSLVRTGYTFAGWNTAANGGGTSYTGGDTFAMGSSNVTLYAQWTPVDYAVTYLGNTNNTGAVPIDGNTYHITNTVTVLGNTGSLGKNGYNFNGWNTAANGSGTSYAGGDTFAMGSSNVTLYAQWTAIEYRVTYNGNNHTGGSVPNDAVRYSNGDTATVLGNTGSLVRAGYNFAGWNRAANGSGTSYTGGDTFGIVDSNVTLYAQWTPIDYTVTYVGNTNTGGAVPTDGNTYNITNTVTVLGNTGSLVKTGYNFNGWNTAANGSGTDYSPGNTFAMGSSNVTLYAKWTLITYSVTYNGNNHTGGSAPNDATIYRPGDTATVLGNTGSLVREGYTFAGWNTAANGSGTSYTGGNSFGIVSNVTLYAQWTAIDYTVTYEGNTSTGGAVPTDANTYNIADTVTVAGNTGSLVKPGYYFNGWNTAANGSGTSYAGGNTFAMGSSNVTLYAQWTTTAPGGGGSSDGSSPPSSETSTETTTILVNGVEQNAGIETKTTENGKTTLTVEVDNNVIQSRIDEAIENNPTGVGNTIQVPVVDTQSEQVKVELTGDIVKKLEENTFDVSVKRDTIEYIIPAEEFTISNVAEKLNIPETELGEIKVEVRITKLDEATVEKYNQSVEKNGAQIIFPPVEFKIEARNTRPDGTTQTIDIGKFGRYVERIMEIPEGTDPSKITTGIVFNPDGTFSHVPTEVYQKDGKWYAKLNSLTNSEYSVIWSPISVKSVEGHWAKDTVNDLASRRIIFNHANFAPKDSITRGDYAEYIIRALGLYRTGGNYQNIFKDVKLGEERTQAILIANEYKIVSGYPDGAFKPQGRITREEAMAMYQRAMKITGLQGKEPNRYLSYSDYKAVSSWASESVKAVLSARVFNGTTTTTISPKTYLTYAEAAQAIRNLLVESKLINK